MIDEVVESSEERRQSRSWLSSPRRVVITYVVLFVIAEIVGAFFSVMGQAFITAGLAFFAVNQAVFGYRTKRTAGLVMATLFSSRLMTLTLPLAGVSTPTRAAIVGAAGCLVSYAAIWVLSQDVRSGRLSEGFALRPALISRRFTSALTVISGVPIGFAAHAILDPPPLLLDPIIDSASLPILIAVASLSVAALSEELLFRRLVAAMVQHTGQSQTPFISGILFAASYLATQNALFVALTFLAGTFFAWSCERTGTLKPVVAAHAMASVLVFVVLP